ncbi:MAG: S1C family serine protease, partial [Candidatus Limnocylindria bacterium]
LHQAAQPAPEPSPSPGGVVLSRASASLVAAADAVVPAVVTVMNRSGGSFGTGSGVVIDRARGYIATNSHVVERSRSTRASSDITVVLASGRTLAATVLGNDPVADVAVIQVEGPLPAEAVLSKEAFLPIGAAVIAIGTPGATSTTNPLANTVTSGIVSATGRRIPRIDLSDVVLEDLIQTDASIGPGMSGGPLVLVDTQEVVGLMTLLVRGDANLGFAIPSATVIRVAERIIADNGG